MKQTISGGTKAADFATKQARGKKDRWASDSESEDNMPLDEFERKMQSGAPALAPAPAPRQVGPRQVQAVMSGRLVPADV